MLRKNVVKVNIQPGDIIVGLASFGQATYESAYNAGMGSNGLTSARHDMFCKWYMEKFPEAFDPNTNPEVIYCGPYLISDTIPSKYFMGHSYAAPENIGKLVLSPTRTYAPIIREVLDKLNRSMINGIIHCSGGGQTKVMHPEFVKNVHIIKDKLFALPPLFQMIQEESQTPWEEMYKVFNMGHRMELYIPTQKMADIIIEIASNFDVEAKIIGHVDECKGEKLTIKSEYGKFIY